MGATVEDLTKAIALGIVTFAVIDIIFRQAISRLELSARSRVDNLSNQIRPALRQLEEINMTKRLNRGDITKLVAHVDSIKPLPAVNLVNLANKLFACNAYSEAEILLKDLYLELSRLKTSEKKFISNYVGLFSHIESPSGISIIFAVIFYSLPYLFIPFVVLYYADIISSLWLVLSFIVMVLYEYNVRRKNNSG